MYEDVANIFNNYENSKLNIVNPDFANLLIIGLLLALTFLTSRRDKSVASDILNRLQTTQLKGLAIFFVVLGHLWVHVSETGASFVFSGDAVAMFLILSGFGITISSSHKELNFGKFCARRIKRILVPYWIATFVIFLFDYVILGRHLPFDSACITLLGINFSPELRHLDHARWFVTFVLLWYILFYFTYTAFPKKGFIPCLFLIAFVWFVFNYYFIEFGYHYFAFPVGCALALHRNRLRRFVEKKGLVCLWAPLVVILCGLTFKSFLRHGKLLGWFEVIPTIVLRCLNEGNGMMLCIALIILFTYFNERGFRSRLLLLLGKYSYEIFLLHGVFLIKYNLITRGMDSGVVVTEFVLFFAFVTLLSLLLSKFSTLFTYAKTTI